MIRSVICDLHRQSDRKSAQAIGYAKLIFLGASATLNYFISIYDFLQYWIYIETLYNSLGELLKQRAIKFIIGSIYLSNWYSIKKKLDNGQP